MTPPLESAARDEAIKAYGPLPKDTTPWDMDRREVFIMGYLARAAVDQARDGGEKLESTESVSMEAREVTLRNNSDRVIPTTIEVPPRTEVYFVQRDLSQEPAPSRVAEPGAGKCPRCVEDDDRDLDRPHCYHEPREQGGGAGADVNDGGFGEAAYCHHRHHYGDEPDEGPGHSTDFDTCLHGICVAARRALAAPPPLAAKGAERVEEVAKAAKALVARIVVSSSVRAPHLEPELSALTEVLSRLSHDGRGA